MNSLKRVLLSSTILMVVIGLGAQFAAINLGIPGVQHSAVAWVDYDNDDDLDLFISGSHANGSAWQMVTRIYRNDGLNSFVDINAGLCDADYTSVDWGDYDNDGDLDLVIAGHLYVAGNTSYISKVYRNDGNDTFTDIEATLLESSYGSGSAAWGDYDNDGDLDILMTGLQYGPSALYVSKIFENNNGIFSDSAAVLPGFAYSDVDWGDYDNDGDMDLVMSGRTIVSDYSSKVFRNDGNGLFVESASLIGIWYGDVAWGDYDNDGDLDILLTGGRSINSGITKVYRNDGDNGFTDINAGLPNLSSSSAAWGDFDNDGDLDILIAGYGNEALSKVYRNDGNGVFVDIGAGMEGVVACSIACGDYDNDTDLDIILTGWTTSNTVMNLYLNYAAPANSTPSIPSNLHAEQVGDWVHYNWDPAFDQQTPSSGLTYSLWIGSSPGGYDILSPMATTSGYRQKPVQGYASSACQWKIQRSALPDEIYWSVQSVDTAFSGSMFAEDQSFSFVPRISLLTPASIQFGEIPVGGMSDWSEIVLQNTSAVDLHFDDLFFHNNLSGFTLNSPAPPAQLSPGESSSILVRFAPTDLGVVSDTLYIASDAANMPILKIRLNGTAIQVPPLAPDNISIQMANGNAVLSWEAVTQTIYGTPVNPDFYLVFHNGSSDPYNGAYYYLGRSNTLSITHEGVGLYARHMFYRVVAYNQSGNRNLQEFTLEKGMSQEEVFRVLEQR